MVFRWRITPAIDVNKSGTRRDELLLTQKEYETVNSIRKSLSSLSTADLTERLINYMMKTKNNSEFIELISKSLK